mgnify:CR=1 FL=1
MKPKQKILEFIQSAYEDNAKDKSVRMSRQKDFLQPSENEKA